MDEKGGDDRVGVGVASADSNATHNHPQHHERTEETMNVNTEAMLTLTLVDPPRWGWSAVGGVTDLLPPHERARRKTARDAYLREQKELATKLKHRQSRKEARERNRAIQPLGNSQQTQSPVPDIGPLEKGPGYSTDTNVLPVTKESAKGLSPVVDAETNKSLITSNDSQRTAVSGGVGDLERVSAQLPPTNPPSFIAGEIAPSSVTQPTVSQEVRDKVAVGSTNVPFVVRESIDNGANAKVGDVPPPVGEGVESSRDTVGKKQNKKTKDKKVPMQETQRTITVEAMNDKGILDIYAYNRGIVGCEARDDETGELLCQVEPIETSHNWEEPQGIVKVQISFPLMDDTEEHDETDMDMTSISSIADSAQISTDRRDVKGSTGEVPQFCDTIEWNMLDPQTPTPMVFASNIAVEFGLTFQQTLDLALSIQTQIHTFTRAMPSYSHPISLKDPYGTDRGASQNILVGSTAYLHDGIGKSGTSKTRRVGNKSKASQSSSSATRPRKPITSMQGNTQNFDFAVETEYVDEVLARAKTECSALILQGGTRIQRTTNENCHICHTRKPIGGIFPCGNPRHNYCEFHFQSRVGMSVAKDKNASIDFCPVCCLTCVCTKCTRKLNSVAMHFKGLCLEQSKSMKELELDVLDLCNGKVRVNEASNDPKRLILPDKEKRVVNKIAVTEELTPPPMKKKMDRKVAPETSPKETAHLENSVREEEYINKKRTHPDPIKKVAIEWFPREMCGDSDLNPSADEDYHTVFYPAGGRDGKRRSRNIADDKSLDRKSEQAANSVGLEEDGSVDYCHFCRKAGGLFCCDQCPRAFHPHCLSKDSAPPPSDSEWECPQCIRAKNEQPEDILTGVDSLDKMAAAFVDYDYCSGFCQYLTVLSKLHEMILKLIAFDFGYAFRDEVDLEDIPEYCDIIKRPMALTTICSNLINGIYAKQCKNAVTKDIDMTKNDITDYVDECALDNVILCVVQDLETVWENCFTFNKEGSAIYRMADVQRRKSHMIRKCSIDSFLSDTVRKKIEEIERKCDLVRGKNTRVSKDLPPTKAKVKQRYSIEVPKSVGGNSRTIAVLDPDTGRIVKEYTTLRAACLAAVFISNLGIKSERSVTLGTVKTVIRRGKTDPSVCLFGYRWLYLDDLREGRVNFSGQQSTNLQENVDIQDATSSGIELDDGPHFVERVDSEGIKTIYLSIETAYICANMESHMEFSAFMKRILDQPVNIIGCQWSKVRAERKQSPNQGVGSTESCAHPVHKPFTLAPPMPSGLSLARSTSFFNDGLESVFPANVSIVKIDLTSGVKVAGFESLQSAYKDWLNTRAASASLYMDPSDTVETFEKKFLLGLCTVDGMQWKPIRDSLPRSNCSRKDGEEKKDGDRKSDEESNGRQSRHHPISLVSEVEEQQEPVIKNLCETKTVNGPEPSVPVQKTNVITSPNEVVTDSMSLKKVATTKPQMSLNSHSTITFPSEPQADFFDPTGGNTENSGVDQTKLADGKNHKNKLTSRYLQTAGSEVPGTLEKNPPPVNHMSPSEADPTIVRETKIDPPVENVNNGASPLQKIDDDARIQEKRKRDDCADTAADETSRHAAKILKASATCQARDKASLERVSVVDVAEVS